MANISQIKLPDNSTYNLADSVARESITSVSALLPHTATITNTAVASFSDGADNVPVSSLIVDIDAVQAGSGTPSPDNVRPITGHSTCTIKVNDDIDDPQTEITTAIALGTTVYGGSLNVTTGVLTITHGYVDLGTLTWTLYSGNRWVSNLVTGMKPNASNYRLSGYLCDSFSEATADQLATNTTLIGFSINTVGNIAVRNGDTQNTPTGELVYDLVTPTTVQLSPTEVRTFLNNNNIFADTGNINELVYFKTGCEGITELIDVMHDDSKMSYSNAYGKKTCNQLTDPGIYYDIDTTGSPAEGYTMTTLITTYNCQILVYLGLVVNIRRVNRPPRGTISFGPWKRLANEDDLDGAVIPYNAEYPSLGTIYDVIESIKSNLVKSVLLTSSMNCTYADSSTIGYRTTNADKVQVSTMTGYPTGKTILGYIFEYAYVGSVGEYYKIALVNLNDGYVHANSKVSGTVRFGLRVIYID